MRQWFTSRRNCTKEDYLSETVRRGSTTAKHTWLRVASIGLSAACQIWELINTDAGGARFLLLRTYRRYRQGRKVLVCEYVLLPRGMLQVQSGHRARSFAAPSFFFSSHRIGTHHTRTHLHILLRIVITFPLYRHHNGTDMEKSSEWNLSKTHCTCTIRQIILLLYGICMKDVEKIACLVGQ
jgi:hypothetical protein